MTSAYHSPPAGSTAHDRARLIVALDGRLWIVAEDAETEAALWALTRRVGRMLVKDARRARTVCTAASGRGLRRQAAAEERRHQ